MKLISYENEEDAFALLKKQMKSRKIENVVDLLQCEVNRIRKKYFENIVMPRRSDPQALTTWEEQYATRLVILGGLDTTIEAKRKLKSEVGIS
jgi:hypothetical protein